MPIDIKRCLSRIRDCAEQAQSIEEGDILAGYEKLSREVEGLLQNWHRERRVPDRNSEYQHIAVTFFTRQAYLPNEKVLTETPTDLRRRIWREIYPVVRLLGVTSNVPGEIKIVGHTICFAFVDTADYILDEGKIEPDRVSTLVKNKGKQKRIP